LNEARNDIKSSDYLKNVIKSIRDSLALRKDQKQNFNIICLGLGKFSECSISRYQFSLILGIAEEFKVKSVRFFDPIFNKVEIDFLKLLNPSCIIEENLEGKHPVSKEAVTLFYLPHCPKQITNNILWKNWSYEQLNNTILLCNSFQNIVTSTPRRFLESNANYLLRILDHIEETELENNFKYTDIFNDSSLHYFLEDEDIELVTSELVSRLIVN
jgi:hypothetical protein